MKIRYFVVLALLSVVITSCKLEGESNYTPDINFVTKPIKNKSDSLNMYLTDNASVYRLDTIVVGDTVLFKILVTGYTNNIKEFYIKQYSDSSTTIILPNKISLDSIFSTTSNYINGTFLTKIATTAVYFPFKMVAKKPSKDAQLIFTVVSDANFRDGFGKNINSCTLLTPIVVDDSIKVAQ